VSASWIALVLPLQRWMTRLSSFSPFFLFFTPVHTCPAGFPFPSVFARRRIGSFPPSPPLSFPPKTARRLDGWEGHSRLGRLGGPSLPPSLPPLSREDRRCFFRTDAIRATTSFRSLRSTERLFLKTDPWREHDEGVPIDPTSRGELIGLSLSFQE